MIMQTFRERTEFKLSTASDMIVPVVFVVGLFALVAILSQIT